MFRNVLFLTHPHPNYVPDLLLHGLRKVLGDAVVDYPRKDCLYEGGLGQPWLSKVPGLFGDDAGVDREDVRRKVRCEFFDLIIMDNRAVDDCDIVLNFASRNYGIAVVDGEDTPAYVPPERLIILRRETDGTDFSIPLQMAMPAELLPLIDKYRDEPKRHSVCFIGSRHAGMTDRMELLDRLARQFSDAAIKTWDLPGDVAQWMPLDDYYRTMQASHCVLSLPGAGMDTFRYWEAAACNSVHVTKSTDLFIPRDFEHDGEILACNDIVDFVDTVQQVLNGWHKPVPAASRAHLLAHHTTERRAVQTLDRLAKAFGQ